MKNFSLIFSGDFSDKTKGESSTIYKDDDPRFYWFDDEDTVTYSSDDTIPYEEPLYQNQLEDPAVQEIMYQESLKEY